MKILWLGLKVLSDSDDGGTGTWLTAMAQGLVESGQVMLANMGAGNVARICRRDCGPIRQWIVPSKLMVNRHGLPAADSVTGIIQAVEEFSPDLVHVWGTESFFGLLTSRNLITRPALLEMQGLKLACAKVFQGGLSAREQLACVGLKEILRGSTIFQGQRRYERWGSLEREMISRHQFIAVQTEWMELQVRAVNRTCKIPRSALALREDFYRTQQWQFSGRPIIFCSAAYPAPFKGLHVAIRAAAILERIFPDLRLRIAGGFRRSGIRRDGYIAWIERQIKHLGIERNVEWLGALNAAEIVKELHSASVMVIPTYIESNCAAMQEAMIVGTPVVASYTGGLPEAATNKESALFFAAGDDVTCAHLLERIISDEQLAGRLSGHSRAIALPRNDRTKIVQQQISIYREVAGEGQSAGKTRLQ